MTFSGNAKVMVRLFAVLAGAVLLPFAAAAADSGSYVPLPVLTATPENGAKLGPRERAFEAAQWAMQSTAAKAMQQLGARASAQTPELAAAVRKRQDLVELIAGRERKLAEAPSAMSGQEDRVIALRGEIDSLNAELEAMDKEIAVAYPRYSELSNPAPLTIADVQSLLQEDEALLLIFSGQYDTYIWAISKHLSAWDQTAFNSAEITQDVKALRAELDPDVAFATRGARALNQKRRSGIGPFNRFQSFLLYVEIFSPEVDDVLKAAKHVFYVADGPLASLPPSVFVTEAPKGEDDDPVALRDTAWLIKRFALTTLPSVSSLASMRKYPPAVKPGARVAFRGFGAPVLGGEKRPLMVASNQPATFFRGALADVDAVRNLPSLPSTGPEVRRLAASLNSSDGDVFLGPRATETMVKQSDLSHVDTLAFATHGLLSGDLKGLSEPALALTPPEVATPEDDGLLTASEIAGLNLSADWVILSACNTAASDGSPDAGGLSGLARAFIYAGAHALLVSHWPVRDDAAARLTTGAVSTLTKGGKVRRAEALRQAMLDVMQDKTDPTMAHPSAWAPFVVVGEGGY